MFACLSVRCLPLWYRQLWSSRGGQLKMKDKRPGVSGAPLRGPDGCKLVSQVGVTS